jgi:DNA-directed RNA polymerase beta subunit
MNSFKKIIALFAFSLMVLALPSIASAQWRDRDNDDYNRNNGRNNRQYDRNLQSTVKNLKNLSKQFERQADRELDRSRIDETRREDRINDLARSFKNAADDLDDAFDNRSDYNRSADEARRVLALGSQIDRVISRGRIGRNLQNSWSNIERNLRVLARAYNYSYNNRDYDDEDYNGNRRGNNRNNRGNFPF